MISISLGTSDFRKLRAQGSYYADKTHLIRDMLDLPDEVMLFSRPRRFGKSAALSMLRAYFERSAEDRAPLFRDLSIWQAGEAYRVHYQRYPVVHVSFKDAKAATWAECEEALAVELSRAAAEHRYLLEPGAVAAHEAARIELLLGREARGTDASGALRDLCEILHRYHKERVLLLIDEYGATRSHMASS